jgi:hypothetical protein
MMGCTVGELQRKMSSQEFSEWIARGRIQAEEQQQAEMMARVDQRMKSR